MKTSAEDNIGVAIKEGRKYIFFPADFTLYVEIMTVGKSFERLIAKDCIIRLTRGIYIYSEIDKVLELVILMLSIERIFKTNAYKGKPCIVLIVNYALNKLSIFLQESNIVYQTDGVSRKVSFEKYNSNTSPLKISHSLINNVCYGYLEEKKRMC